jgi:large subunit ribosomal protein L15
MKGFTNPFRVEYHPINLDTIADSGLTEVTPEGLLQKGLVSKGAMVKILGRGQIDRPLTVKAHAVSKSAQEAISDAGGTVEILPPSFKGPRPPPRGNQHTNR